MPDYGLGNENDHPEATIDSLRAQLTAAEEVAGGLRRSLAETAEESNRWRARAEALSTTYVADGIAYPAPAAHFDQEDKP